MSHSFSGKESSSVMEERNGVPFSGAMDFRAAQPSQGSGSSSTPEVPENTSVNQLVLYVSQGNDTEEEVQLIQPQPLPSKKTQCPSIGAFTVQCSSCFKWRLMPSMQKYEELREQLLETPFFCERACEWKPNMSCDVPEDISQDGTRLWALDKPSIPRPPAGWQRELRFRGEGCTKFADVYYVSPSGKKFRSTVEVQKYLNDNPQYISEEVKLSRFSFQTPKPLQENYVRKRPAKVTESSDKTNTPVATEANPVAWVSPDVKTPLQPTEHGLSGSPSKKPRTSELPATSGSYDYL